MCAECHAHRLVIGTRRIVALAPFDGLGNETKELVRKLVHIKRCKPIVPALEEWAPSLREAAPAKAKAKPRNAPPTPKLDAAEAWLAKVLAAKTAPALEKLDLELQGFDIFELMNEDADRWQELDRSVCDIATRSPMARSSTRSSKT